MHMDLLYSYIPIKQGKLAVLCEQAIVHVMPRSQSTADNSFQVVSQKCRLLTLQHLHSLAGTCPASGSSGSRRGPWCTGRPERTACEPTTHQHWSGWERSRTITHTIATVRHTSL